MWSNYLEILVAAGLFSTLANGQTSKCYCLSTSNNGCFPSTTVMKSTFGNSFMNILPYGAPCHDPYYNANECSIRQAGQHNPFVRMNYPGSMMTPAFEGGTCLISSSRSSTCTNGQIAQYGVNATTPALVQAGMKFVRQYDLKMVVLNTGHDYLGRNTGAGSFMIWTHYLRGLQYSSSFVPVGAPAGTQGQQGITAAAGEYAKTIYDFAASRNLVVVGGAATTVGLSGGFVLGGGHGPLTRSFGYAADNVIQMKAVLADGSLVIANAYTNPDLFWALRGGGGSTFAIVVETTFAAYPTMPVAGMYYIVSGQSAAAYKNLVINFFSLQATLGDKGWSGYYYIAKNQLQITLFKPYATSWAAAAPDVQPFLNYLNANKGSVYVSTSQTYSEPNFDVWHANHINKQEAVGYKKRDIPSSSLAKQHRRQISSTFYAGSRIIPYSVAKNNATNMAALIADMAATTSTSLVGHLILGGAAANKASDYNAINPAMRTGLLWFSAFNVAGDVASRLNAMVGDTEYINEGIPGGSGWQQRFWGSNYNRLLAYKKKIDPGMNFPALPGGQVGAEYFSGTCRTVNN